MAANVTNARSATEATNMAPVIQVAVEVVATPTVAADAVNVANTVISAADTTAATVIATVMGSTNPPARPFGLRGEHELAYF